MVAPSLKYKYQDALRAWDNFKFILAEPYSEIIQDATIQRFRYTYEATWKFCRRFLKTQHDVISNNPKAVFHALQELGYLNEKKLKIFLDMTDRRNESTQSFKEPVAHHIFKNTKTYARELKQLLDQFSQYCE